ncbi:MAG: hypothetical protein L0271_15655 [Gemmatimonadetes bacterium]|nr:hypothetical protein [Gemmatimonadota bacterium]
MSEDPGGRSAGDGFREGVRSVTGLLGALKDALEATFDDLRTDTDASSERARDAAAATIRKAQEAVEGVRERLDFVTRREFEALRAEVAALRAHLGLELAAAPGDAAAQPPSGDGDPEDTTDPDAAGTSR